VLMDAFDLIQKLSKMGSRIGKRHDFSHDADCTGFCAVVGRSLDDANRSLTIGGMPINPSDRCWFAPLFSWLAPRSRAHPR
jgi:hypothetical protein